MSLPFDLRLTEPHLSPSVGPSRGKEGLREVAFELNDNPKVFDLTTPSGFVLLGDR